MRFEWDERKNASNLRKHRVSFETAALIFRDPRAVTLFDRVVGEEERWHTIGRLDGVVMLLVVHTDGHTDEDEDDRVIRTISARKATAHERREYEGYL